MKKKTNSPLTIALRILCGTISYPIVFSCCALLWLLIASCLVLFTLPSALFFSVFVFPILFIKASFNFAYSASTIDFACIPRTFFAFVNPENIFQILVADPVKAVFSSFFIPFSNLFKDNCTNHTSKLNNSGILL